MSTLFVLLIALLVLWLVGTSFFLWMFRRNQQVHSYRQWLISQIDQASQADIQNGDDYKWRYVVYAKISYEDMMRAWWRPLDSFYPDKKFIQMPKRKLDSDMWPETTEQKRDEASSTDPGNGRTYKRGSHE